MLFLASRVAAALCIWTSLLAVSTVAETAASSSTSSSPPVNIRLRTPWQAPPLLLELLEAANTEDPTTFYPLLTELTSNDAYRTALSTGSAKEVYTIAQTALDSLSLLQDAGARRNWEISLALHTETAKVAAFWQLADTLGAEARWKARTGSSECLSWVDWYGDVICSANDLHKVLDSNSSDVGRAKVATYPFDHILPAVSTEDDLPTAVLYADPLSENFAHLHQSLLEKASGQSSIRYILRWKPTHQAGPAATRASTSGYLAGYGGALDLKKVDYLVLDDRKLKHASGAPSLANAALDPGTAQQLEDREWVDRSLLANATEATNSSALSEVEIETLGFKAAQAIVDSDNPLRILQQLSQDFPLHAQNLARGGIEPSYELEDELSYLNMRVFRPGTNDLWLNGRPVTENEATPQSLIKLLKSERSLIDSLMSNSLNLTAEEAVTILANQTTGKAQLPGAERQSLFDSSDRIERKALLAELQSQGRDDLETVDDIQNGPITWWNDIERDPEFHNYSPSLKALLRQLMPGQFPQIRRNVFNVIWIFDLRSQKANEFLTEHICGLIGSARIPLHWGLVPGGLEEGPESDATRIARLYWHVFDRHGTQGACQYLEALAGPPKHHQTQTGLPDDEEEDEKDVYLSLAEAQKAFANVLLDLEPSSEASPESIASSPHPREGSVKDYLQRLRVTTLDGKHGHMFFNGQYFPYIGPNVFQLIMQLVSIQSQSLQRSLYLGELKDDTDIANYFYDQPSTFAGRSALVFPPVNDEGEVVGPKAKAVDLSRARKPLNKSVLGLFEHFIYPDETTKVNATVWLVGDFDAVKTQQALQHVLKALQSEKSFRLGFLHRRSLQEDGASQQGLRLSTFLAQAIKNGSLSRMSSEQLLEVLREVPGTYSNLDQAGQVYDDPDAATKQETLQDSDDGASYLNLLKTHGWSLTDAKEAESFWTEVGSTVLKTFGIGATESALIVNGRVISGVDLGSITTADVSSLLKNEGSRRIDPVLSSLPGSVVERLALLDRNEAATAIADIASVLSLYYYNDESKRNMFAPPVIPRVNTFDHIPAKFSTFEVGNRATARLRFYAILDPLAEKAQKWSSIFRLVTNMDDVYLKVILNPQHALKEMPLKRFYRYSAPSALSFDDDGQEIATTLSFYNLPQDAVLTMGLDAPPAWLTMASEAVYDLDNIRLRDVPEDGREAGVLAVYDLKQILIEGHAREVGRGVIPKGLQLLLQTSDGSETLDTTVTANLAYFQFRARPGLYRLSIRPGRGDELYEMKSVGNLGWDSPGVEVTGDSITLDSLQGLTIYPTVKKRPGKEKENLIEGFTGPFVQTGKTASGAKSVLNGLRKATSKAVPELPRKKKEGQADLNIFTVASGHLYERMTYIMILSVLRHTSSTVKFWFIENFLSPSFKEFIPHLAKEYGFQYEMVTYAWPHWLRPQREKQRTIWGYKILFLDVLFPLDLDKVIFVDSDQVVRSDLKELTEVDLEGAPYGFPPMGDDSYDMDGYRFWKQGYWKDFLKGRPYHISALYVVDLQKFRSMTAGDILREQYHGLSADPNSLSNLDQDLPQVMMDHIPIHTLDQEWLWCETWCSTDWLHKAKTIDLCSNPKTHEAKLDRARRQIPEWTELDEEVQRLARKVSEEKEGSGSGGSGGGGVVVEEEAKVESMIQESQTKGEGGSHQHDEL